MPTSHIYQIPFPEAGHGINMLNVGSKLASPELQVHVLSLSRRKTEQWLKASGQPPNKNLTVHVINDGKWEDWEHVRPSDLVMILSNPEWLNAIETEISSVKESYPNDNHGSITVNALMAGLVPIAAKHELKIFALVPVPYYCTTLDGAIKADGSSKPEDEILYKNIGGSTKEMPAILGDMIDFFGPMMKMSQPVMDAAIGMIYSNTNQGLEGDEYLQTHSHNKNSYRAERQKHYLVGPILPASYEQALDDPTALQTRLKDAPTDDPCIAFLNSHPPKSVVYITLGSVSQFTRAQAMSVITELRKYKIPWMMLYRKGVDELEAALSSHPDGMIAQWAPQLDVLLHPSTKCVLGHGGFGTMIEGVFAGQAFICSPIFSDQFIDTKVMSHLGICVGNIAENRFESIMKKAEVVPYWPDDGGKLLESVFERAFGERGEDVLGRAREASLALRKRMIECKSSKGVEAWKGLIEDLQ